MYSLNNETTVVYKYKWFEFYFGDTNDVVKMYFRDKNYSNNEDDCITFTSPRKLLMFFESLK